MSSERNKALSQELYEAVFGHGDLGAADRLMAPRCVSHPPGLPPAVGTDAIKLQAQAGRSRLGVGESGPTASACRTRRGARHVRVVGLGAEATTAYIVRFIEN